MNLCNYNWNISTLKLLHRSRIYTTELYINTYRGTENFAIRMEGEYNVWIGRKYGKFKYFSIDITTKVLDGFIDHYSFDNQHNIIRILFYSRRW
jgi:hypothetical protein